MSTKSTISYGPGFHLYSDLHDEDCINLQVDCGIIPVVFEASNNSINISVPVWLWEHIRQFTLEYITKYKHVSEVEMRQMATDEVDDQIKYGLAMFPESCADVDRESLIEERIQEIRKYQFLSQPPSGSIKR